MSPAVRWQSGAYPARRWTTCKIIRIGSLKLWISTTTIHYWIPVGFRFSSYRSLKTRYWTLDETNVCRTQIKPPTAATDFYSEQRTRANEMARLTCLELQTVLNVLTQTVKLAALPAGSDSVCRHVIHHLAQLSSTELVFPSARQECVHWGGYGECESAGLSFIHK